MILTYMQVVAILASYAIFSPMAALAADSAANQRLPAVQKKEEAPLRASNEVLRVENSSLLSQIAVLAAENAQLKAQISRLASTNAENAALLSSIATALATQQPFGVVQAVPNEPKDPNYGKMVLLSITDSTNAAAVLKIASAIVNQQPFWASQAVMDDRVKLDVETDRSFPDGNGFPDLLASVNTNQPSKGEAVVIPKNEGKGKLLYRTPRRSASPTHRHPSPKNNQTP